jgi:hypothetical protein
MSASDRLKALGANFDRVTPIMRKTGPKMLGSDAYLHAKDIHAYVNALPQIVAVVEAAERSKAKAENHNGNGTLVDIARTLHPALSALEEVLT